MSFARKRPLVIWGGTGHARVLHELVQALKGDIAAIVDNRMIPPPFPGPAMLLGMRGLTDWLAHQVVEKRDHDFAIAIGGNHGRTRLRLSFELEQLGLRPRTLAHAKALLAANAELGDGCQVLMGATVAACARIGRFAIINTRASIDHDCLVGDGAHVGPGAILCGEIEVGECAFIGAGATILPKLRIGADSIVGAGAVVTRDVAPGATVVGTPARELHRQGAQQS